MMDVRDKFHEIKRALARFTKFEALVAVTKSIDGNSDRVEVHLLDVPAPESFAAMELTVQQLFEEFGDLPWLVFAHARPASQHVRTRFAHRADRVVPRNWWHADALQGLVASFAWQSVLLSQSNRTNRERMLSHDAAHIALPATCLQDWINLASVRIVFSTADETWRPLRDVGAAGFLYDRLAGESLSIHAELPVCKAGPVFGAAA